jgi:N-acetylglutamate synthase-like GNAT family acetyltransferase
MITRRDSLVEQGLSVSGALPEDELVIRISTDRSEVDLDWLHAALAERSYWALGRSREMVERSVANSLCYSAFDAERQVGFARVVTDQATFAWVCDVFVDDDRRGQGIGRMLMAEVTDDPRLAGLKRTVLVTSSPDFYAPFGFAPIDRPERWMLRQGPGPTD